MNPYFSAFIAGTIIVMICLITISCATSYAEHEVACDNELAHVVAKRIVIDLSIFQGKMSIQKAAKYDAVGLFNEYYVHPLLNPNSWKRREDDGTYTYLTEEELIRNLLSQSGSPKYVFLYACASVDEQNIAISGLIRKVLTASSLAYNRETFIRNLHRALK